MRYYVTVENRTLEVEVGPEGLRVDGEGVEAELHTIPGTDGWRVQLGHASHRVSGRADGAGAWALHLDGRPAAVDVVDERTRTIRELTRAAAGAAGPKPVKAPMPGLVVRVEVEEGDEVREGQGVVIVEAMKMENELRAESIGRVAKVRVQPGDAVEKDQVLLELVSLEDAEDAEDALDAEEPEAP